MAADWSRTTVNDIKALSSSSLATGPFGSSISSRLFQDSGVPVIRGSNLSDDVGLRLIHDDLVFVSEEKARTFGRSIARHGDLIFTCWGTIGQVGLIDSRCPYPEYVISNKQMKLTADPKKADSLYLYYLFSGPEMSAQIKGQAIGSSVPGFNLGQLRALPLYLPPLSEQRTIAKILGSVDDKIELNRRTNATLEAMARTLFQSWFVDFDPVRAKAEGREPAGMDAATAELFPSAFEDSPLGEIPQGWSILSFDSTIDIVSGGTPKTSVGSYWNGDIPWFSVVDAPDSADVFAIDTEKHITEDGLKSCAARVLPVGTSIISARGTVGKVALVAKPMAMNQSCYGIIGTEGRGQYYTYYTLKNSVAHLQQISHGAVFDTITRQTFQAIDTVSPPMPIVLAFDERVRPLMSKLLNNRYEVLRLTLIRDALLPKLLSGELRVEEAATELVRA